MSERRVTLVEFSDKDQEQIDKMRKSRSYYDSFEAKVNDDYDIEFVQTFLEDYHRVEYGEIKLVVVMPEDIKRALMTVEEKATKTLQREIKQVLGIRESTSRRW